jgi:hypothetical protein
VKERQDEQKEVDKFRETKALPNKLTERQTTNAHAN